MAADLGNLERMHSTLQAQLGPFRRLILDTAARTQGVGEISESVKWGEPSYTPAIKGIGSSVRLAPRKDGKVSIHFICHTGLINRFRVQYPNELTFEGNRTIVIDTQNPPPLEALRHCISMALTYFRTKS
jgi:hypothetical protein